MTVFLRSGELLCRELGISAQFLADCCNAEKYTAYSPDTGEKILPSHRCIKEFRFKPQPLLFEVTPSFSCLTLAIRDICCNKLDIFIRNTLVNCKDELYFNEDDHCDVNVSDLISGVVKAQAMRKRIFVKNIKKKTIKYEGKKYILYQPPNNIFNDEEIFPINKFRFRVHDCEYDFKFECLYIVNNLNSLTFIPWNTRIIFKDIETSNENRKCVHECDFSKIDFDIDYYRDFEIYKYVKDNKLFTNPKYKERDRKCLVYKVQQELVYKNPSNGNILEYCTDFFKFNIDEFILDYMFLDNNAIRKIFYDYIKNMLFDKEHIESTYQFEMYSSLLIKDPRYFIISNIDKHIESGVLQSNEVEMLRAYKLKSDGETHKEVYINLYSHVDPKLADTLRSKITKLLNKCPDLFKRLKIPFIDWKRMTDPKFPEEKDIQILLEQLKAFYRFE